MLKLSDKQTAIAVGALIIIAYGVLIAEFTDSRTIIMIADVISGLAVIGIPLLLYPYLRSASKGIVYFYLVTKVIEGLLMVYGGFAQLSSDLEHHKEFIYEWPHMIVFILGGFALYYLFYVTKLVPRFISIWGGVAIAVLMIQTLLGYAGVDASALDPLLILIITNEIFLAIWLMVKGFKLENREMKTVMEV